MLHPRWFTFCLLRWTISLQVFLFIIQKAPSFEALFFSGILICYCLSKQQNCFSGICSSLMIWQLRCTADALFGMRHVIPFPLCCPVIASVTQNGSVNHI